MTVPRRVLRIEPTGRTFAAVVPSFGAVQLGESRLVATDDTCGNRTVLLDLPARTSAVAASWSLDARRVAAVVRRYGEDGRLQDHGIWVGETGGSCGDVVCGFHLAASWPVEAGSDGVAYEFQVGVPSWSSDGRRVVYGRALDAAHVNEGGLFVADLGLPYASGTQADRQVFVPGGPPYQPAFSPVAGDDRIAFVQRVGTRSCTRNDIFITTSAGGTARRLSPTTVGVCQLFDPAWSPDGQWFAYSGWSGAMSDQQAIYRVKADGSGKPVLVAGSKTAIYRIPTWRQ
jgi:Tol biopolymer transport system component